MNQKREEDKSRTCIIMVMMKDAPKKPIGKLFFLLSLVVPIGISVWSLSPVANAISALNIKFIDNCEVDYDDFMESNASRCAAFAQKYENTISLYHLPRNLTGDGWDKYIHTDVAFLYDKGTYSHIVNESTYLVECDYDDTSHPLNNIGYYTRLAHSTLPAGYMCMGEACRYAIGIRNNNQTEIEKSLIHINHTVDAISLLTQITGDGSMARYIAPNTSLGRQYINNWIFREEYDTSCNIYPVEYEHDGKSYTFYVWGGTSVDCYHAVFGGLGFIYLLCNNTAIRHKIRNTIDRMLTYFVNTGWKMIDRDGKTHSLGAESLTGSPLIDTMYVLMYLRVGKTVNPEKWGALYDKYVHERLYGIKTARHINLGITDIFLWGNSYFNVNMPLSTMGILIFLEEDSNLKDFYRCIFAEPAHEMVKYHRNTWFDCMYYLAYSNPNYENYNQLVQPKENSISATWANYISASIGDSLTRMTYRKFPFRDYPVPSSLSSYSDTNTFIPIPNAPYSDIGIYSWHSDPNINSEHWLVKLLMPQLISEELHDKAIPSDWMPSNNWMHAASPFFKYEINSDGATGAIPAPYLAPYWIGRFLKIDSLTI